MRRLLLSFVAAGLLSATAIGQVSGTFTIPGAPYTTIASAISAINSSGVGSGGVTFNVTAGYTETFASNTAGYISSNTATAANQIIFQKSGSGANPKITAGTGIGTLDAIICFNGVSYVTFNGIDVQENPANITTITQMEWGFALLKVSGTQGSQNITIKNCAISLNATNMSTYAVYSNNHTTAATTSLTVTAVTGANSNNSFSGLTITNCYGGLYIYGYSDVTPYAFYDQNNQIGVASANTITGWGGGANSGYGIYSYYQNGLKVANTTLTSAGAASAAGSLYAIYLSTGNNSNVDIYGNTVTATYNGTGSFYSIYSTMGGSGTSNTTNIYNNTVTGCSMPNMTTGTFYGFYNYGGTNANWYNNSVTNNTYGSATATATGAFYGFYFYPSQTTSGPISIHDNAVTGNTRLQSVVGAGFGYYFYPSGSGGVMNCYNNTISNNSTVSNSTQYLCYLIFSGTTKYFYNNTITNFQNTSGSVYGIYTGNGTNNYMYNNKIQNINAIGTASVIYGLYSSSGTYNYWYNNFVSELKAPNSTSANAISGGYVSGAANNYYFYNTIYLNATTTAATFGTSGIYASASYNNDLRDNIIVNTSANAGGAYTVALRYSGAVTAANYAAASNNNDFYAGTPGANNLIYFDGTNSDLTLPAFKIRVSPRDNSSVTENPPFVNVAASPYDLHLQTTIATQCESGGVTVSAPVNILTDYDNTPRFPNAGYPNNPLSPATAPDIGADEFGGLKLDLTPPNIAFNALLNTSSTLLRTLSTTITDASGVPTSGTGLPRLFWKKNQGGTWNPVTATFVSGNTYTFTLGSGVVLGDSVYYYLVAQDLVTPSPNVGSNPPTGSGYTVSPPACATPPYNTSCYAYKIVSPMCGSFNVGVGQTYATLTAAVNDLAAKEMTCPVTFVLTDNTYPSEAFPIILPQVPGWSSTNTLTIKPGSGKTPAISGVSTSGIFVLYGSQYVIIDGSNSGGTDRSLTWENTNTAANTYTIGIFNNGSVGASNITFKNCNIKASSQVTNSTYALILNALGGGYNNIIIDNNWIYSSRYAMQFAGVSGNPATNGQITNNTIGSAVDATSVQFMGILVSQADNTLIQGNEVMGAPAGNTNTQQAAIELIAGSTNTKIRKNKLHDFYYTGTGGYGTFGVYIATADASTPTEISNNLMYNFKADGWTSSLQYETPAGIQLYTGGNMQIYYNTIYLSGACLSSTRASFSSCISVCSGAMAPLDIRDNILKNSMTPVSGNLNFTYGIYNGQGNSILSSLNYNDYYVDGIGPNIGFQGVNQATFTAWQTATGKEANGLNVDPVFVSATDLHPTALGVQKVGTYISSLPADYSGTNRTSPPDVGAYQVSSNTFTVNSLAATAVTNSSANLNGSITASNNTVTTGFDYGLTTAYGTSVTGIPSTINGNTATSMTYSLTGLLPLTTYHFRATGVSGAVSAQGLDVIFTTLAVPPTVVTTAATLVLGTTATVNGTVNANGSSTAVTFDYGLTTAYGTTVPGVPSPVTGSTATAVLANLSSLLPGTTYHYRVNGTNTGGTANGLDLTFTTNAIAPTVVTTAASGISTSGGTLNGTITANGATTTASFEYGTTIAYGSTANAVPATVTGITATPVSAVLTGLLTNTTYHFRAKGVNSLGTNYGSDLTFSTSCTPAGAAGPITGPAQVCTNGSGYTYSIAAVVNATSYLWTVPAGATITSGATTNIIIVTFGTTAGNITAAGVSSCGPGTSSSLAITVNPSPVPVITGPATACTGASGNVYSTQTGNTGYTWTVSAGGTITAGAGTSNITVTWNTAGAKTVTVNYTNSNGCTAAAAVSYGVNVNTSPAPTITGATSMCATSGYYSYTTESGQTGYSWSVSSGGSIISGSGTNMIEVSWNNAGAQTVSVNYSNASGCQAPASTVLNIAVSGAPSGAGAVSGPATVCAGQQGVGYSIASIAGATAYAWTLPTGATITNGNFTNAITVNFASNAQSGAITASGNNLCGNGTSSPALNVSVTGLPAAAGAVTGPAAVCKGTAGVGYTVPPVANATAYTWTVPTGATITAGATTNSIIVTFGASSASGNVTVYGSNSCGNGTNSSLSVTVNPIPPKPVITANGYVLTSSAASGNQWYHDGNTVSGATGQTYTVPVTNAGWYWTKVTLLSCSSDTSNHLYIQGVGMAENTLGTFNIYPVPNDGHFTALISYPVEATFNITIFNELGVMIYRRNDILVSGTVEQTLDIRPAPAGVYTVVFTSSDNRVIRKILVNK